jgi:hypothetical protein
LIHRPSSEEFDGSGFVHGIAVRPIVMPTGWPSWISGVATGQRVAAGIEDPDASAPVDDVEAPRLASTVTARLVEFPSRSVAAHDEERSCRLIVAVRSHEA